MVKKNCLKEYFYTYNNKKISASNIQKGEIVIIDTNKTDQPIIASSKMDEVSHSEPVAKVLLNIIDFCFYKSRVNLTLFNYRLFGFQLRNLAIMR
jgi:hypothetical protein